MAVTWKKLSYADDISAHSAASTNVHGAGTDYLLAYDKGSLAQGDILYFNGTKWVKLAAGNSGQFLKTQGANANPAWATLSSLPSSPEQGDIVYYNGLGWVSLSHGTAGQVLQTGGHAANPSWSSIYKPTLANSTIYNSGMPWGGWSDLNLSSYVGARVALCMFKATTWSGASNTDQFLYKIRANGETVSVDKPGLTAIWIPGPNSSHYSQLMCFTDGSGIIEHGAPDYNGSGWNSTVVLTLIGYI